jgi:hypothetical protein
MIVEAAVLVPADKKNGVLPAGAVPEGVDDLGDEGGECRDGYFEWEWK